VREKWQAWRWKRPSAGAEGGAPQGADWRVRESLRALLEDPNVPPALRAELAAEYQAVTELLEKLEQGHIHIAAFGRVSVGKSSLLNALLGAPLFGVSALHGSTRAVERHGWQACGSGKVFVYDTPGIDEIGGEAREQLAHEVISRCDLVLFVVEADLTAGELAALREVAEHGRPVLLVLNKSDRYTEAERDQLLARLREHAQGLVRPQNVLACAAAPAERIYIEQRDGREVESRRQPPPAVTELAERIWSLLEAEGKALLAVNAGLFAGRLSDRIARRITELKQQAAARLIRNYAMGKAIAVGANPVPGADLASAAALDVTLLVHLSRVYGLPITRREAGGLFTVVAGQIAALMGSVWAIQLVATLLKVGSVGLSTLATATAQGAVAYYATHVLGRAAERYFSNGKAWGPGGPKQVVRQILDELDRDSLLQEARAQLRSGLRG
jgi:GTPase